MAATRTGGAQRRRTLLMTLAFGSALFQVAYRGERAGGEAGGNNAVKINPGAWLQADELRPVGGRSLQQSSESQVFGVPTGKWAFSPQAVGLSTRLLLHLFFERRYCRGG
jgi:hypothetical protein